MLNETALSQAVNLADRIAGSITVQNAIEQIEANRFILSQDAIAEAVEVICVIVAQAFEAADA